MIIVIEKAMNSKKNKTRRFGPGLKLEIFEVDYFESDALIA